LSRGTLHSGYRNYIPFSCYQLRKLLRDNYLTYNDRFLDIIELMCVASVPVTAPLLSTDRPAKSCLHAGTGYNCRSQRQRCQRCRSTAVRLLGLRVRIPPGAWMCLSCECCVLPGRCLCDWPIFRPGILPSLYASPRMIKCNNNPLHLRVGRKKSPNKERRDIIPLEVLLAIPEPTIPCPDQLTYTTYVLTPASQDSSPTKNFSDQCTTH
jgi:hypothetical protein